MRNVPYWLNIGSILYQYGCATRVGVGQFSGQLAENGLTAMKRKIVYGDRKQKKQRRKLMPVSTVYP